jgi:NAD(P)-dependent dehydrogenase (short-subunit alcohol dehydrogenase family)
MEKRLRNRVALIADGTTGAGLATARRFAAEGADVILGNVADDEQNVARFFATLGRKHGRLDILFLNIGIVAAFDESWSRNVRGLWLALKHAIPILSDGAAVIVDTSMVDQSGFEAAAAYGATQGALRSLVRIAARELAERHVRVNGISLSPLPAGAEDVASAATFLASRESSFLTGTELAVGGTA